MQVATHLPMHDSCDSTNRLSAICRSLAPSTLSSELDTSLPGVVEDLEKDYVQSRAYGATEPKYGNPGPNLWR